ncbi:PQQ-dependent sugar dehydrogenase [Actibacterium pelagium]|uniref:Glucose dehydrogenase n=1 Tax=Actibacterium pelagium TaxID=2029103 RepID=A0A917AH41_9RHOB|nr:PQQ-dependent sugar dehydrogenase [Actibacterium pelagium]GGE52444.1 glucose dehydrogenase [Actibacterium pelagium]
MVRFTLSALALTLATTAQADPVAQGAPNVPSFKPAFEGQTRVEEQVSGFEPQLEIFATGLERPWGITPLPEGGYLVTERPGRLRYVSAAGQVSDPLTGVPEVLNKGQGGLLDVTLGPDFANTRMVYLTYAKRLPGLRERNATAVAKGRLADDMSGLEQAEDIFVQSPPSTSPMHYGSRILFGDDGLAFVTLGEHSSRGERELAQDLGTTYGKVIRIAPDGSVPEGNPFSGENEMPEIWSYGHRNPQGAALHPETGALWTIEHGPKGGDELNRIDPGANYGWPVITYGENYSGLAVGDGITQAEGMEQPVYYWDPVIAPSGMTFYDGEMFPEWQNDLLIGSLNPGGLVRLRIEDGKVTGEERFLVGEARFRDVEVAPDGSVLVLLDQGYILRLYR